MLVNIAHILTLQFAIRVIRSAPTDQRFKTLSILPLGNI